MTVTRKILLHICLSLLTALLLCYGESEGGFAFRGGGAGRGFHGGGEPAWRGGERFSPEHPTGRIREPEEGARWRRFTEEGPAEKWLAEVEEQLRISTLQRDAPLSEDIPYVRVRLADDPAYDARILKLVRDQLAVKLTTDHLLILNLADDVATEARLREGTPQKNRDATRELGEFLTGTDEEITPGRLRSILDRHRGETILILGHITQDGAIEYRGSDGGRRRLPLDVLKKAEEGSNTAVVVLGCGSGTRMPVGPAAEINSVTVAEALREVFREGVSSFADLYGRMSGPDLRFTIDPVEFDLTGRIDVTDRHGGRRGRVYIYSNAQARLRRPNAQLGQLLRGGAAGAVALGVAVAGSFLFGVRWAVSLGGGIKSISLRILGSLVAHLMAVTVLIWAIAYIALGGTWTPFVNFGTSAVACYAAARLLAKRGGAGALRPFYVATAVRLLAFAVFLAVATTARFDKVLSLFPWLASEMSTLVAIALQAPDLVVAWLVAGTFMVLLGYIRPVSHLGVIEFWLAYGIPWCIHPRLVRMDLTKVGTPSQLRHRYACELGGYLAATGLGDAKVRDIIFRVHMAVYDELQARCDGAQPFATRDYGSLAGCDPWNLGRPEVFFITGFGLIHDDLGDGNVVATTDYTPHLVGLVSQGTDMVHFLPHVLSDLWRRGAVPSQSLPEVLARLEPWLRKGDFLAFSVHQANMWRRFGYAIAVLFLAGAALICWGVGLPKDEPRAETAIYLAFVLPALLCVILPQGKTLHWRRLRKKAAAFVAQCREGGG